jgi:hypothetical protein
MLRSCATARKRRRDIRTSGAPHKELEALEELEEVTYTKKIDKIKKKKPRNVLNDDRKADGTRR